MRQTDVVDLFDYNYWANRQVLAMAAGIPHEQFTAPSDSTWRNIRGTLVHILDVERSWRGRLRGEPREAWDDALSDEDYPTAAALEEHWSRDEAEMRSWLEGLDDTAMEAIVDLGGKDRFPMWYFLVHVLTHGTHQRRDVVILLTNAGTSPREIDFLDYGDWLSDRASG